MDRFNVKSLLLGIGIGIIITSIASIIYLAGQDPFEGLSKEQIMAQAEKYGMVRNTEAVPQEQSSIFITGTGTNENGDEE